MKSLIAASLISVSLLNVSYADPVKCPGATDIQAQGEEYQVTCKGEDCNFSLPNHRYDTDLYWHFFINLKASSSGEAETRSKDALKSLIYQSGPTKEKDDLWFCHYGNSYGYEAIAAYSSDESLLKVINK
jgi:hypothetical protein